MIYIFSLQNCQAVISLRFYSIILLLTSVIRGLVTSGQWSAVGSAVQLHGAMYSYYADMEVPQITQTLKFQKASSRYLPCCFDAVIFSCWGLRSFSCLIRLDAIHQNLQPPLLLHFFLAMSYHFVILPSQPLVCLICIRNHLRRVPPSALLSDLSIYAHCPLADLCGGLN